MTDLFPTRGDLLLPANVTPRRLAARTKRSLTSIRQRIEALSGPWIEVDGAVEFELESLLDAFDRFERTIDGSVKYLNEPAP